MIIKSTKPLIFINDCNAIFDEKLLEEAIYWYSSKPVAQTKHIFIHGCYPAISIYGEKIHIHRLIKMYSIGHDLDVNEFVHHIDGNKLNSSLNNLAVIDSHKHGSLHNKGRHFSEEHKRKIAEANHKRKGIKIKKRVEMPELKELLEKGYSINKIANYYGCDWSTVKNRIYENPELLEEANNENT